MNKYINAEELISKILKLRSESCISESDDYYEYAKSEIIDIIESLQQKPIEWCEEDNEMLDAMIDIVSNSLYEPLCPREGMLAWLKSIKDRILGD